MPNEDKIIWNYSQFKDYAHLWRNWNSWFWLSNSLKNFRSYSSTHLTPVCFIWVTPSVWLCLGLSIFITGLSPKILSEMKIIERNNASSFLVSLGIYCQQGNAAPTNFISTRCLIVFVYLSGILSYNFYTSVLISIIVDSKFETKIKTAEDIVNNNVKIKLRDDFIYRHWIEVNALSVWS